MASFYPSLNALKTVSVRHMTPMSMGVAAEEQRVLATSAGTPGEVHDNSYYMKCMMGGILSCGLTHTAIVPLDLVKCRMQVRGARREGWRWNTLAPWNGVATGPRASPGGTRARPPPGSRSMQ